MAISLGLGSLLGGVVSTLGGLFSNSANNNLQVEQAEKNREFQSLENQKTRDFSERMWNLNNAYNSPSSIKSRLLKAGLNPSMMYAGSSGIIPATTSSVGTSATGAMPSTRSVMDGVDANVAKTYAETRLLEAEAKKTNTETDAQLTYNKYQEQLLSGKIELNNTAIRANTVGIEMTEAEKQKTYKQIEEIDKNMEALDSQIRNASAMYDNISADTLLKQIDALWKDKEYQQRLDVMASEMAKNYADAGLSSARAKEVLTMLPVLMSNVQSDTALKVAQRYNVEIQTVGERHKIQLTDKIAINVDANTKRIDFDLENDKTFRSYERGLSLVQGIQSIMFKPLEYATDILGAIRGGGSGNKTIINLPRQK